MLNLLTKQCYRFKITNSKSSFRTYLASTRDASRFNARSTAIKSEIPTDTEKASLRIKEVKSRTYCDVYGSTKKPIQLCLKVLLMILKYMGVGRSLFYFTFPGLSLGIGGSLHGS